MSEYRKNLVREFQDREYREAYADDFLNTYIATQIKVVREERKLTQQQLADLIGTKQAGISRFENVNYSAWNIGTLRKVFFALGLRLKVSGETFGSLLDDAETFSRESLNKPKFEDDPAFKEPEVKPEEALNAEALTRSWDDLIETVQETVQTILKGLADQTTLPDEIKTGRESKSTTADMDLKGYIDRGVTVPEMRTMQDA